MAFTLGFMPFTASGARKRLHPDSDPWQEATLIGRTPHRKMNLSWTQPEPALTQVWISRIGIPK